MREGVPMLRIAMVLDVLLAVLGLATAIFSQKLIDETLPNEETNKLWLGLGLLGFLLLVYTALGYLRTFFLFRQSKDFNNRLMDDFYDKLLHLPRKFLDEPTAAMDSKTEEFVLNLLKELKKDKILLMIKHRRNFENLADQVVVLKNGITHQTILNPAVMK
jgi:ABC-type bacteriocin/lantibiotic exporter with double-glycine peptidase domain